MEGPQGSSILSHPMKPSNHEINHKLVPPSCEQFVSQTASSSSAIEATESSLEDALEVIKSHAERQIPETEAATHSSSAPGHSYDSDLTSSDNGFGRERRQANNVRERLVSYSQSISCDFALKLS